MPSIIGYVTDEQEQAVEELVEAGQYDNVSQFVQHAVQSTLYRDHEIETELMLDSDERD